MDTMFVFTAEMADVNIHINDLIIPDWLKQTNHVMKPGHRQACWQWTAELFIFA